MLSLDCYQDSKHSSEFILCGFPVLKINKRNWRLCISTRLGCIPYVASILFHAFSISLKKWGLALLVVVLHLHQVIINVLFTCVVHNLYSPLPATHSDKLISFSKTARGHNPSLNLELSFSFSHKNFVMGRPFSFLFVRGLDQYGSMW